MSKRILGVKVSDVIYENFKGLERILAVIAIVVFPLVVILTNEEQSVNNNTFALGESKNVNIYMYNYSSDYAELLIGACIVLDDSTAKIFVCMDENGKDKIIETRIQSQAIYIEETDEIADGKVILNRHTKLPKIFKY